MDYRKDVRPAYHRWIRDGIARLRERENRGMLAALQIAHEALTFTYQPMPGETRVAAWITVTSSMTTLRNEGVTAETMFARVCELAAYFEDHQHVCMSRRAEDFAYARAVMHMVRWNGRGRGQGAQMLEAVGAHIREHLIGPAQAVVRKLRADQVKRHELAKQALDFAD